MFVLFFPPFARANESKMGLEVNFSNELILRWIRFLSRFPVVRFVPFTSPRAYWISFNLYFYSSFSPYDYRRRTKHGATYFCLFLKRGSEESSKHSFVIYSRSDCRFGTIGVDLQYRFQNFLRRLYRGTLSFKSMYSDFSFFFFFFASLARIIHYFYYIVSCIKNWVFRQF